MPKGSRNHIGKNAAPAAATRSRSHNTPHSHARSSPGLLTSSPWSQCFSQSYASILPTSLGHIHPIDQRLFTSESGCGYRYGLYAREEIDLRRGFHENNQGTERYKNCTAFSVCSDAFHQLKCHSRRQQRQREKRTLHRPGYPSTRRC